VTKRVLVVDDDRGLQETLRAILGMEGYEVVVANNGLDALTRVGQERLSLVLLDVMMPRLDGYGFMAELARRGQRDGLPIVVLTADARAEQKAGQMGADGWLTKPFDLDALLDEVARLAR
jgi:two-component system response regulator MprA